MYTDNSKVSTQHLCQHDTHTCTSTAYYIRTITQNQSHRLESLCPHASILLIGTWFQGASPMSGRQADSRGQNRRTRRWLHPLLPLALLLPRRDSWQRWRKNPSTHCKDSGHLASTTTKRRKCKKKGVHLAVFVRIRELGTARAPTFEIREQGKPAVVEPEVHVFSGAVNGNRATGITGLCVCVCVCEIGRAHV